MEHEKIPMIQVGDAIITTECLTGHFCCQPEACKGACCVEGDAGAPLELDEVAALEEALPTVWPLLSDAAKKVIEKQGVAYVDEEGDLVTSIVDGKDCVFTCYDGNGCCLCALEKMFREGKTAFQKPISCHLYPLRLRPIGDVTAVEYHRWEVCRAAIVKGESLHLPIYKALREPLIRRFGKEWYAELEEAVAELKAQGYID